MGRHEAPDLQAVLAEGRQLVRAWEAALPGSEQERMAGLKLTEVFSTLDDGMRHGLAMPADWAQVARSVPVPRGAVVTFSAGAPPVYTFDGGTVTREEFEELCRERAINLASGPGEATLCMERDVEHAIAQMTDAQPGAVIRATDTQREWVYAADAYGLGVPGWVSR